LHYILSQRSALLDELRDLRRPLWFLPIDSLSFDVDRLDLELFDLLDLLLAMFSSLLEKVFWCPSNTEKEIAFHFSVERYPKFLTAAL
jgi:hypothetical protein